MRDNSSIKEKALHPEQSAKGRAEKAHDISATQDSCTQKLDERICVALKAASDKKAIDPVILDLREIASFTDYFIITSGTNVRQVQAIADEVVEQLKKQGTRAARMEGYNSGEWVLVDYGDFVVHVFDSKARQFYDLERLWRDAVRVQLPEDATGAADSSLRSE
ncbi:MAG: ribosome silencing factor [Pyrinomonadaceae bacterium]|nr:ribosome silencing factor [Pyrinomonadaceae bacterium]